MNVYLISGSYTMTGFEKNVMEELKKDLDDANQLSFVPTDFSDIEKNRERCEKTIKWFKEHNISFDSVHIIDDSISDIAAKKIMAKSNIIFLNGGDTLKQMEGINKKNIRDVFKNNVKNIIGMSAGAINMAKTVLVARDIEDNIPETMQYPGIGVTDINIEPHCEFDNIDHWKDLLEASKINKIYCMRDNCSIIIRNGKPKFLGNYCIINKGKVEYSNIDNE